MRFHGLYKVYRQDRLDGYVGVVLAVEGKFVYMDSYRYVSSGEAEISGDRFDAVAWVTRPFAAMEEGFVDRSGMNVSTGCVREDGDIHTVASVVRSSGADGPQPRGLVLKQLVAF